MGEVFEWLGSIPGWHIISYDNEWTYKIIKFIILYVIILIIIIFNYHLWMEESVDRDI